MESWIIHRTLRRIGGSLTISLPVEYIKSNKFSAGQRVRIRFTTGSSTLDIKASEEAEKEESK